MIVTLVTLLSLEKNGNIEGEKGEGEADPPRGEKKDQTIESDASQRHSRSEKTYYVMLDRLPAYLNVEMQKCSVTRFESMCHIVPTLVAIIERNEDEYHRVLGLALQVAADHPILSVKFPPIPLDLKHTAAHLIGELIVTGRLEGFENE